MKRVTFVDRVRYSFDNTMARGPAGLVLWLAAISAIVVVVVSALVFFAGNDPDMGFPAILWDIFYQTFTPNPVDPKAGSPTFLGGMLFVTLVSILLVSIFIGILTNAIDHRIQNLRKGRSLVIEKNHTLILGWSPQVYTIIAELVEAKRNQRNACVVILADRDQIEMEDDVHTHVRHLHNLRVVCRTGDPLDQADLHIVNPDTARAIIVLAPEVADPDTQIVKTLLALMNHPELKPEPYHIVAEISEPKNMQVAQMIGRDQVQLVLIGDLISRITVQTCRQSGLSVVYTELLNFGGDEIYFKVEPPLVGKTFGEALFAYEDSAVIGLHRPDGRTQLNPPMDTRIGAGDQVVAISENSDTIKLSGLANFNIDLDALAQGTLSTPAPERTLILGWNASGSEIVSELDHYVPPHSQTTVVANLAAVPMPPTTNQVVAYQMGDTTDRAVLDLLGVATFDHIIVLSYSDMANAQQADAQTLITLLHLRDMSEKSGKEFSIVSEMIDLRNRQLAEVTRADDFIVSDHLVSLMLAQVSENKYLNAVFADLFDPAGSEIYLKPASNYIVPGRSVNFYTIVESARRRGEIAIGYRLKHDAHDAGKAYGVVVNPDKSKTITLEAGDKVIVVAAE